jgi:hypothetical protein
MEGNRIPVANSNKQKEEQSGEVNIVASQAAASSSNRSSLDQEVECLPSSSFT